MSDNKKFLKALAERAAKSQQEQPAQQQQPEQSYQFNERDLITDEDVNSYKRSEEDETIDSLINRLGVMGAYKKYIHKMVPKARNKRESVMISCPMPNHPDKNPSAWMNLDKDTWFCGACQRGGDVYDLAAIGLGFDVDDYKTGQKFGELRRAIADSLGYTVQKIPGVENDVVFVADDSTPTGTTATPDIEASATESPATDEGEATSTGEPDDKPKSKPKSKTRKEKEELETRIRAEADAEYEAKLEEKLKSSVYTLDWRKIAKEDTFLYEYMKAATQDYNVEEYHFWQALIALGVAIGRDVHLEDQPNVYGNLFVCLLGGSGSGKSKSKRYMDEVIQATMEFDYTQERPRGVKDVATPNSSEFLVEQFSHPIWEDGPGGKYIKDYASIRSIIQFGELGSLMNVANRKGSELSFRLLEFYDCKERISTGSRATGSIIAEKPFACALTTTQPKALHKLLGESDEDSGFLNRWLFVGGHQKVGKFWSHLNIDLTEAKRQLELIHLWCFKQRAVKPTKEVEKRANDDMRNLIQPDMNTYDPILGRLDLTIKKLCLLLCANEQTEVLTIDIYERVMLMYDYLKAYALFRYENLRAETTGTRKDRVTVEVIRNWYENNGSWPTLRELTSALPGNLFEGSQQINKTIQSLTDSGLIEAFNPNTGKRGRPTYRYKLTDEKES